MAQQSTFDQANEAYREGDFDKAVQVYQDLLDEGWESAELYYNLGNALYKQGELGEAIWALEKALVLDPNFENAMANRELLQAQLVDEIEAVPTPLVERFFRTWADRLGTKGFRWLMVFWMWMIGIGWSVWRFQKSRWSVLSLAAGLLLLLLSGISWGVYEQLKSDEQKAVVIVENIYVKTAPSNGAPDAFVLHEGTTVFLDTKLDDWQEIKLADGQVGWINPDAIKPI